ncbi:MAG: hypothetical protein U0271_01080 [Polyangiaceae bacterium]
MIKVAALIGVTTLALGACKDKGNPGGSGGGGGEGASGGAGAGGAAASCEGTCEYPFQDLPVTVREGFTATDPVTGRVLPLLARFPTGATGSLPLVIWSHGGGFDANGHHVSEDWGNTFAGQGYAVIHIAHIPLTTDSGSVLCDLGGIAPADCSPANFDEESGFLALAKTRDVIAVLDALPDLSDASVAAGGPSIDLDHVVIAGWSAGSRAPQVVLGAKFAPLDGYPPIGLPDPRPVASIGFSPAGPEFGGFFEDASGNSWQDMRGPILYGTGTMDVKPDKPELTGAIRRVAFDDQPTDGERWLLYSNLPVGVGGHSTFNLADLGSSDERLASFSLALRSAALAFLDAEVKGDATAEAWLASNNARVLAGDASWEHK